MTTKHRVGVASPYQTFAKWAFMAVALLWTIVYQLSQQNIDLPGFVYVNF